MKKLIIIALLLLTFSDSKAQSHPCGFNNHMNERYQEEPSLLEMREFYEAEIQQIINSRSSFNQKTIPVVVHVIYNDSYSNISTNQVNSALTAINEDFNASNSDYNSVIAAFSSIKSNLNISFELANLDPNGNTTTGITRTQSDFTDNADENVKGLILWNPDMYLNIWVVDNIESGAGAYAYYPGTAPNGNEGIVCRHTQFGTTGTSSSNNFSATTLTHEIGHYLNLAHTWGDSNDAELEGNCNNDDNVNDTPNTIGTLYGCNTNQNTCGSLDNVQNYMDYTDCTNMFTKGQRARVHASLHSALGGRINLWQNENLIATGILEDPSCDSELSQVEIQTGSYANEISWVILNSLGEAIAGGGGIYNNNSSYNTPVCLENGSYTFQAIDSYGDGWNGGSYTVKDCSNSIIANNVNPSGNVSLESFTVANCSTVSGCTNPTATNYNNLANQDDGSCIILGCTQQSATNYNPNATQDDNSCIILGCTDINASNYNPNATQENNSCIILGCTQEIASNYDSNANQDDNSCLFLGCIDETALNFDPTANLDDDSCNYIEVPELFDFNLTGSNHTLVFPQGVNFNLVDSLIANLDVIGVFYTNELGIEKCAGYIIWEETTIAMAIQGDDTTTDEIDGYQEGETLRAKVWDRSEDIYYNCEINYSSAMPNQGEFASNGISAVIQGSVIQENSSQLLELPAGWSLFSSFLTLDEMSIDSVLNPIFERLIIVKDYQGLAYLPEWSFNGIGEMIYGDAYLIKISENSVLELNGLYNLPEENPITIRAGWSLIGYLRTEPADCIAVLQSINSEIEIVKNGAGDAYLPTWNFNAIGDLEAGLGYAIKMASEQTLQFKANTEEY